MTRVSRLALTLACVLPGASLAGLGVPDVAISTAEQGMEYLRSLGYQGVAFSDANRDQRCQMAELTLRDYKDGARDSVLWKELRKLYDGLDVYQAVGNLKYGKHMFVLAQGSQGINAVDPVDGDLVFGTWFTSLSQATEVQGKMFAQATSPTGKAWVSLSEGGKFKGEYFASIGPILTRDQGFYSIVTNAAGQQNAVVLPSGKLVSKIWLSKVEDVADDEGDAYLLASANGEPSNWLDGKGRPVPRGELTEVVGLSFAKGIGGLRGKNDKGEWANVSLKGKPLGQGFQVGKVGPVEVLGGEPAFKSCGQQCTFVSAKKGEDLLPRGFADVGERVWHFEGRDVILAKDNQGRWSYLFAESGEPLTGSWYTRVDEPSTANALFTFVATKISGQSVYLIVTPEGNTEEKPASAAKDSAPN